MCRPGLVDLDSGDSENRFVEELIETIMCSLVSTLKRRLIQMPF
jgi:hypothetical protein